MLAVQRCYRKSKLCIKAYVVSSYCPPSYSLFSLLVNMIKFYSSFNRVNRIDTMTSFILSFFFSCKWCNKYFWDPKILKKHSPRRNRCIRDVVSTRKVMCDQCGAQFSSESNLRNHQNSTHSKDELTTIYECYICHDRASFDRVHRLKYHMQKCHIGKRLVECKLCLRKLESKSYSRHYKTHLDVNPFQCSYKDCSKQFKFLNRLQVNQTNNIRRK